jgi:hypothetical protein
MAIVSKEKYDPEQVEKLYDLVRLYHDKDKAFDYEIIVDKLRVVKRTSDPEMFYLFENFVGADTKAVEIVFYTGTSNVNERRIFSFIDEPEAAGLAGIDLQETMKYQLEEKKNEMLKEIRHEQVEKENQDLKSKISELETAIRELEKENEQLVGSQSPLRPFLGEIGSSLLESFIRRNPKIVKNIPGGEALAGLIEPAPPETADGPEADVSFQPKERSSEDQMAITFVNQLKAQFRKDEFDKVVLILQKLAVDKSMIDQFLKQYNT